MKTFSTMKTFKTVAATAMLAVLSLTACGDRPAEKMDAGGQGVAQDNAQTTVVSPLADSQGGAAQSGEMNAEDRGVAQNDDVTVIVSTLAGSGSESGDRISDDRKWMPQGIVIDATGNFYVTDTLNHRILKVTKKGEVSLLAGGKEGFANGQGSAARFSWPAGIAMDATGNLYVADSSNHRIRKVTPEGEVSTLAGGKKGFADGQGSAARFNGPSAIAIDAAGNLYVADGVNNRICKVTPKGEVSTLAGGRRGFADGQGSAARFWGPSGIAVDAAGNLYVVDNNNYSIRKITPKGKVSTLAGDEPDSEDEEQGSVNEEYGLDAEHGFEDGQGSAAQFGGPCSIVIDAAGNLYVTDSHRIRKVTPDGTVSTLAGGEEGFADGEGSAAQFNQPFGIAIDAAGNLYVADTFNHRIRKIEFRRP